MSALGEVTSASGLDPAVTTVLPGGPVVLRGAGLPVSLVGGKAAALDRLIGWGLPVPPTAVITTDAFRTCLTNPGLASVVARLGEGADVSADEIDAAFDSVDLDADLLARIHSAGIEIAAGGTLAVRSSATVEDQSSASFAGQFRSVLDVDPASAEQLTTAIKRVWASLLHAPVRSYRAARGVADGPTAMAVVLMPMIPSVHAGVVFTEDPVGPPERLRVEYVSGLAEAVVSGTGAPTTVTIARAGCDPAQPDELRELAALALEIERLSGAPQDIEWTFDGSHVWILQARPITMPAQQPAVEAAAPSGRAELTTAGIAETLPGVLPPLIFDVASLIVEEALHHHLAALGAHAANADLLERGALVTSVRGRAALDLTRLSRILGQVPGAEARLRAEYFAEHQPVADRTSARRRARLGRWRQRARAARHRRQAAFDAEVTVAAAAHIEPLGDARAARLGDRALLAHHVRLLDAAMRGMAAEVGVADDAGALVASLQTLLERHLAPGRAAPRALAVSVPHPVPADSRASAAVFAGPTWTELGSTPAAGEPTASLEAHIEAQLGDLARELGTSPRRPSSAIGRWIVGRRIDRLAEAAAEQATRRERAKAAVLLLGGELRRVHLEAGRRLHRRGLLEQAADVELLSLAELRAAILQGDAPPVDELRTRRRQHELDKLRPALPEHITADGHLVDVPDADDARLVGRAASGGRFTGPARVLTSPSGEVSKDEVLVATVTDPSWTPVLLRCGGLVVEQGGPLSHAAIVAREFGIPAVFGVPGAAGRLTGRVVEVDGDRGVVTVLHGSAGDA